MPIAPLWSTCSLCPPNCGGEKPLIIGQEKGTKAYTPHVDVPWTSGRDVRVYSIASREIRLAVDRVVIRDIDVFPDTFRFSCTLFKFLFRFFGAFFSLFWNLFSNSEIAQFNFFLATIQLDNWKAVSRYLKLNNN